MSIRDIMGIPGAWTTVQEALTELPPPSQIVDEEDDLFSFTVKEKSLPSIGVFGGALSPTVLNGCIDDTNLIHQLAFCHYGDSPLHLLYGNDLSGALL